MRDGLFIQNGPPAALLDGRYLQVVALATCVGVLLRERVQRFGRVIATLDALGLGAYAAFGVQKALANGLSTPAAVLIGVLNAAGGGILRDVLTREEPLVFKPGQFYVLAAFLGATTFVVAGAFLAVSAEYAAFLAIGLTFAVRVLSIRFNWRTTPFVEPVPPAPR